MSEPPSRPGKTLKELVSQITDENRHEEIDFGPPVGREILDPMEEIRRGEFVDRRNLLKELRSRSKAQ